METKEDKVIKNISCFVSFTQQRPKMTSSYYLKGVLEEKDGQFFFKAQDYISTDSFCLVEWRYLAKKWISQNIHLLFYQQKVANLMTALTVGTLEDRMLKFDFGRLGLQHILAISGFHFGLLAFFLRFFFRLFFKEKLVYLLVIFLLTLYLVFLGNSASILRAYLAICLYLIGRLFEWRSNGLNLLGAALLIETMIDPLVISNLGFQFSFLATFSILFLMPLTKKWMNYLLPDRDLNETKKWPITHQGCYLLCRFFKSTFALNIAVTLPIAPVCLFYFHKFPIMSLAYNTFIPFAFSASLFLFFLALPFIFCFPYLGIFLNKVNEEFTSQILSLISQSPLCFDIYLRSSDFSISVLFLYLVCIFSLPFLPINQKIKRTGHPVST